MKDGFYHLFYPDNYNEYWQIKNGVKVCNFSVSKDQLTYIENSKGYYSSSEPRIESAVEISEAEYMSAKIAFINRMTIGAL